MYFIFEIGNKYYLILQIYKIIPMDGKYSFDSLPEVMGRTLERLDNLELEVKKLAEKVSPSLEQPVNVVEAARILGKKPNTVYQLCSRRELPHFFRGQLYFFLSELVAWIRKSRKKTLEELGKDANCLEVHGNRKAGR